MLVVLLVGEGKLGIPAPAGPLGQVALLHVVHDVEVAHLVVVGGSDVGVPGSVTDLEKKE